MKTKFSPQSVLIVCLIAAAFASTARAQTPTPTPATWTGTTGSWLTCTNWSNSTCPDSSTDAFINNGGTAQILTSGATAHSLTLGKNAGDSGEVDVDGYAGGSLVIPPPVSVPDGPDPVAGAVYIGYHDRGTLKITSGGTVSSWTGYIAALSGNLVTSSGAVTISGPASAWTIGGTEPSQLFIGGNGTDTGGTALLTLSDGGQVEINNPGITAPVVVGLSGTLTGNGFVKTTGSFMPGTSVFGTLAPNGTLHMDGKVVLQDGSAMVCNVTPSSADNVDVTGKALLGSGGTGGRLLVTMTGDFTSGTTQFVLLHASDTLNTTRFKSVSINYPANQGFKPQIDYSIDGHYVYLDLVFNH